MRLKLRVVPTLSRRDLLVAIIVDPSLIRLHRSIHCKRAGHRRGCRWHSHSCNNFNAATAASLCAGHAQQLGGESPPPNLMEVKG